MDTKDKESQQKEETVVEALGRIGIPEAKWLKVMITLDSMVKETVIDYIEMGFDWENTDTAAAKKQTIKETIIEALGRIGTPEAEKSAFMTRGDALVKRIVLESLGRLGITDLKSPELMGQIDALVTEIVFEAVLQQLSEKDYAARVEALRFATQSGPSSELVQLFSYQNEQVCMELIERMGPDVIDDLYDVSQVTENNPGMDQMIRAFQPADPNLLMAYLQLIGQDQAAALALAAKKDDSEENPTAGSSPK